MESGAQFAHFRIIKLIGKGGMGEVFQASDQKLGRDVAIKILPEEFARDADRRARFEREAKTLASLNHPNIAQIYGLEKADGIHAIVMELVEGPTLADRIAQGALPLDEALPIAKQIALALEAAHELTIIHRDLKAANVKVREDGVVKVLDFGLAKALEPAADAVSLSQSPTLTTPGMTGAGVILGTPAYMSPEQARGKSVDKRADIWAFGCVLYEMLTGQRAFSGEDVPDTLAAVMRGEPDWTALPTGVPQTIRTLLRRCLEKDRRKRAGDIAAALFAIDESASRDSESTETAAYILKETASAQTADAVSGARREMTRSFRRRMAALAGALVIACAAAGVGVWLATRPEPPRVVRTTIATSGAAALNVAVFPGEMAITPDGSRIVYRGVGGLVVRALDQLEPTVLSGLGAPGIVFVSPDGQWVGFNVGRELRKVAITGGPPVMVSRVDGQVRGATWGTDGTIIYATNAGTGLQRVSAAGGDPAVLTKPDRERGELGHYWPEFLPGGQAVLFTILPLAGPSAPGMGQIAVLDLQTGASKVLLSGGSSALYVPTGHLLYSAAGGSLRVVGFDIERLAVVGTPVPVPEQVGVNTNAGAQAMVSGNGTLVYLHGLGAVGNVGGPRGTPRSLVWVDRQGRETSIPLPPRTYAYPRLSPDGTRAVLDIRDEQGDLWVWELARQTLTRLTFDPGSDFYPVWTPDGRRMIYFSGGKGGNILWQPADGTGMAEQLTSSMSIPHYPYSISPDGKSVVFQESLPKTGIDLSLLVLDSKPRTEPLIQTAFTETNAEISPDGDWIAYQSNESGREEIYVRPFPKVDGGRWQVSTGGGTRPVWARNGRELFYLDENNLLTTVAVQTTPTFRAANPVTLFKTAYFSGFGGSGQTQAGRTYDVSPDGQRFLMIKDAVAPDQVQASIVVVQNWFEELKRLAPVP